MEDCCVVCAEPLEWVGYGWCGHRDVCSTCIVRLRFIMKDESCCICKQKCSTVVITKALGDYTRTTSDFSALPAGAKEGLVGQYWFHEDSQSYFDDEEQYKMIKAMCQLFCSICEKSGSEEAGGKDSRKRGNEFKHIDQLKRHLYHVHKNSMCELCLEGRKVFLCEQRLYTRVQLDRHLSRGDSEVDGSERERGGFMGHPMCDFCKKRFYGENELYLHMSREHYTCHICQRMHPGHYEYYQNYNDLEAHFHQEHFLCENGDCLAKKFVVFVSESELKRHNAMEHGGNMSRSQRNAVLQIPVSFQYRRAVNDHEPRRGGRGRGHNANDHLTAAIQASLETATLENAIRESTENAVNPGEISGSSSSFENIASSSTSTGTSMPSRYLKAVSRTVLNSPLEDSAFPPLPVVSKSAKQKSKANAQRSGKTMAAHLRGGRGGVRVINATGSRHSVASGQVSSSVSVNSSVSEVDSNSNTNHSQSTVQCNSIGGYSRSLPSLGYVGGMQSLSDHFPPIPGKQNVPTKSASESQNSATSNVSSLSMEEMQAANKSLLERIRTALGDNKKQFATFKDISAQYRHGQIDAQNYYSYICQYDLSHLVLELVRLCPELHKQRELLEVHNVNMQKNTQHSILQAKSNLCRKEKSIDGAGCSGDTSSTLNANSVDRLKLGRTSDGEVDVLSKDGYRAAKGKSKIWVTNDHNRPSRASGSSSDEMGHNFSSELPLRSSQSSIPGPHTDDSNPGDKWPCHVCTLVNKTDSSHCVACETARSDVRPNKEPNSGGKEKRKKKTSKFQRVRLGDGSAAALLNMGQLQNSSEDKIEATSTGAERPSSRGVWGNGGGKRLMAIAQRESVIDSVWNS